MNEKMMDVERARVVDAMCMTWRHDFGLDKQVDWAGSSGMTDDERDALRRRMGQLYDHHFAQARASQPVGVPDGWKLVPAYPTPAMSIAGGAACGRGGDFAHHTYAMMLAAAPAAPAVKAEQVKCQGCKGFGEVTRISGQTADTYNEHNEECQECQGTGLAPFLTAAGSAGEEVEVVGYLLLCGHFDDEHGDIDADFDMKIAERLQGELVTSAEDVNLPLMTVAQHNRIVAALSAQQSEPERVSVDHDELELLREYRNATINFINSHGVETDSLEEAVEIEREAESRLEAAEKACWDFYS